MGRCCSPGEAVTSLGTVGDGVVNCVAAQNGPMPLSGTSYSAPVVSGLAALIRARFPALTARQVVKRIEATAHHPPGGWNPLVGNGVIDVVAAVSTDAPPTTTTSRPREPSATISPPAASPRPNRAAKGIALTGATICFLVLAAAVSTGAVAARLPRPRTQSGASSGGHDDVTRD
ncbi:subtilase family protein [Mycobacterium xenopi 4042]|uniref:Subtilase family protein n=1 Tax=Mycobacterium xenopi 4042 TaxID=1299334 RepID=X7YK95_MYCXE|nr:subtilase family protein [Mycobacterium xenopi 4042]